MRAMISHALTAGQQENVCQYVSISNGEPGDYDVRSDRSTGMSVMLIP